MADVFSARVEPAGWDFTATADDTLLQAGLVAGVRLPNSCRNGTCRTCLCVLDAGEIAYEIEWPGLTREEKAEGLVLPCVARPLSDVVLRYPEYPAAPEG